MLQYYQCTFGYVKYRFVKSGDENIEPEVKP
jgi:hypothetical protein